jgi:hypothetical protein
MVELLPYPLMQDPLPDLVDLHPHLPYRLVFDQRDRHSLARHPSLEIYLLDIRSFPIRRASARSPSARLKGSTALGLRPQASQKRRRPSLWWCSSLSAPALPHLLGVSLDIRFSRKSRIRPSGPERGRRES